MSMVDLAKTLAPDCEMKVVGIRPGEKLHEVMIPMDDGRNTIEFDDHFVIEPSFSWWSHDKLLNEMGGKRVPEGFEYSSDKNTNWVSPTQLREMLESLNTQ
jgi:UDP-N-acetylglucosamine 4,6-dehydratase